MKAMYFSLYPSSLMHSHILVKYSLENFDHKVSNNMYKLRILPKVCDNKLYLAAPSYEDKRKRDPSILRLLLTFVRLSTERRIKCFALWPTF